MRKLRWSRFPGKEVDKAHTTNVHVSPSEDGWDVITRSGSRRNITSDAELVSFLTQQMEKV